MQSSWFQYSILLLELKNAIKTRYNVQHSVWDESNKVGTIHCVLQSSWCPQVPNHEILGAWHSRLYEKSKISSHPKAKIGCLWHPGTLKHSPVDVNWSLKNSYYPSYLFLLVLREGLQIFLDQVMIIHVYEPQEILMNNTCLKKTPPLRSNEVLMFSTMQKCKQKWILKLTSLFTSAQGTVL